MKISDAQRAKQGNYDRMFYDKTCRNRDKAQRIADERARYRRLANCPTCGQAINKKKAVAQDV